VENRAYPKNHGARLRYRNYQRLRGRRQLPLSGSFDGCFETTVQDLALPQSNIPFLTGDVLRWSISVTNGNDAG
jgi:hypothetical protein